ncbi:MAG: DNA translocase FtsK 4TM domain-containing protein [Rhodospirillales bacterium]|nr:DNA translocase FtsK 4TM domain-containing protein [Rhodospirillales bacterium]
MARILTETGAVFPAGTGDFMKRRLSEAGGLGLLAMGGFASLALATYSPGDPSFNSAAPGEPRNLLGFAGASVADALIQTLGLAAAVPVAALLAWGWLYLRKRGPGRLWFRLLLLPASALLVAAACAAPEPFANWPLLSRMGGAGGDAVWKLVPPLLARIPGAETLDPLYVAGGIALVGVLLFVAALGLSLEDARSGLRGAVAVGSALHGGYRLGRDAIGEISERMSERRLTAWSPIRFGFGDDSGRESESARAEPNLRRARDDEAEDDARDNDGPRLGARVTPVGVHSHDDLVAPRAAKVKPGKRAGAARQGRLPLPGDDYTSPPLDLLDEGEIKRPIAVSEDALAQNAKLLARVLEDFGISGEIVKVRPGPVVTLYELEPAPGTKTSRVIALADDIARSMSAVSARIAVVPGRNVIGIELPNVRREMVHLRELLASETAERAGAKLPLALGKDIAGAPVVVDLARMPHLLIAGTTGSGKSVAMNTMILSLVYQLPPDQCRFIMIDPKMLELSVYEGIPHLLCPVVTNPAKAVVALKWTVREMEERYRAMSQLGVRNIAGYNARLNEAKKRGETLSRRVQTGFDDEGKPVFEDQPIATEPLPFIVVVVDEMADLMLVAGKDIEAAVQRLAQMARAAGVHLIMATQRPSVDVITGTIKANFPTRVSFQVTSKIDSRTILGEPGAEQLLGQGDMLYMAGGGRISRIHGPFVSDQEVEAVVRFLKTQGAPAYVEDVTEEPEEPSEFGLEGVDGEGGEEFYDQAVALVAREGKASTSFIQRHFQIGYNRAARIIERMEAEGVVSKPNRVGRREVLVGGRGAA